MHTQSPPDQNQKNPTQSIDLLIDTRPKDLGGFYVRRALPTLQRQTVGPFIFFDHMGPAEFAAGQGIDVRPHPHIGLATVSWLFEGELVHRDSLGYVQTIQPGAVNLMIAGNGIVHSERSPLDRSQISRLHGIQLWLALPTEHAEITPQFLHYPATDIPQIAVDGALVRVVMGSAYRATSPVNFYVPTLYLDIALPTGSAIPLPQEYSELAVYVAQGSVLIEGVRYQAGSMAIAAPGQAILLNADTDSRVMVIGGEPIGKRYIWWNFVSSSLERIRTAAQDWQAGRFDSIPADADEFIPLPKGVP